MRLLAAPTDTCIHAATAAAEPCISPCMLLCPNCPNTKLQHSWPRRKRFPCIKQIPSNRSALRSLRHWAISNLTHLKAHHTSRERHGSGPTTLLKSSSSAQSRGLYRTEKRPQGATPWATASILLAATCLGTQSSLGYACRVRPNKVPWRAATVACYSTLLLTKDTCAVLQQARTLVVDARVRGGCTQLCALTPLLSHLLQSFLQVALVGGLLGQQVSMQVVVLQVQVDGATQPSVALHNHVGGQASESLSNVLVLQWVVQVIVAQAVHGQGLVHPCCIGPGDGIQQGLEQLLHQRRHPSSLFL
mmetsp:Transcript_14299/g.38787  ORF Transcript_14299/g.38787 Transcript_14299/m.38787 type:complete len:304 (-) Transcript_14299:26-937(-)